MTAGLMLAFRRFFNMSRPMCKLNRLLPYTTRLVKAGRIARPCGLSYSEPGSASVEPGFFICSTIGREYM
jgi:hypothetical protein